MRIGALLLASACAACTEIPAPPDFSASHETFAHPTGSLRNVLPDELADAFIVRNSDGQKVVPLARTSADAEKKTLDGVSDLPFEGFIRMKRRCSGFDDGVDPGTLNATISVRSGQVAPSFSVVADKCREKIGGGLVIDAELAVMRDGDWLAARFSGSLTEAGATRASKPTSLALRVCVGATECHEGDVELAVELGTETFVLVVSPDQNLVGIRDREGLWSCSADPSALDDTVCTRDSETVVIEGIEP